MRITEVNPEAIDVIEAKILHDFSEVKILVVEANILKTHTNVRHNLAVHCSVTPFTIQQPIWRPRLLERVYKPMCTFH